MPELPEVETVVRDLRPLAVGRAIVAVRQGSRPLRQPWNTRWNHRLNGAVIDSIRRRGKWIVLELSTGSRLVIHLGMTGQLTVVAASQSQPDHVHLVFMLDNHAELRFRDIRRFGGATLFPNASALDQFFLESGLGPEPFAVDVEYFRSAMRKTSRNIKAILLDQRVLAGVGNIYADESCFRARLDPRRAGNSLTIAEADRLRDAIETVLTQAITQRGSSIRNYIGGSGLKGRFQNEFAVYGRTGQPCMTCQTSIVRLRLAGRSTHYCPQCQTTTLRIRDSSGSKRSTTNRALRRSMS